MEDIKAPRRDGIDKLIASYELVVRGGKNQDSIEEARSKLKEGLALYILRRQEEMLDKLDITPRDYVLSRKQSYIPEDPDNHEFEKFCVETFESKGSAFVHGQTHCMQLFEAEKMELKRYLKDKIKGMI